MGSTRHAVIDVGTNSVKLLVANVAGRSVIPLCEESEQTRLGRGFYETHQLQLAAIDHTAAAVAHFARMARIRNARTIRVIATSAARDATNRQELIEAIEKRSGLSLEIISGEQEAEWVYQGVRSDPRLDGQRLLILDVGGGSSEFVVGHGDHADFGRSFPLGSVRLLESVRPSDPPRAEELQRCRAWLKDFFTEHVRPVLDPFLTSAHAPTQLVGTGGASTIVARMEYSLDKFHRDEIEGARISARSVNRWVDKLWSMPLQARRRIVGLPKKRADVILTGILIFEAVLREFGFTELRASTRGLRFAAITSPLPAPKSV